MATVNKKNIIIGILVLMFILIPVLSGLYIDYLWFGNLGLAQVFTKILFTQVLLAAIAAIIFFALQMINLYFSDKEIKVHRKHDLPIKPFRLSFGLKALIIAAVSVVVGFGYHASWEQVLLYLNQSPFRIYDPIFNLDIAFYIFTLPIINMVVKFFMVTVVLGFLICTFNYLMNGNLSFFNEKGLAELPEQRQLSFSIKATRRAKVHLSFLGSLFFVLMAVYYYLKRYSVLYSTRGIITGAGYTDVNVTLPILIFLVILSAVIALELFIWPNVLKRKNIIPITIGAFLIIVFVALTVLPGIIQYVKVLPNELKLESPFIDNNIEYTRYAYGLTDIKEINYEASTDIDPSALEKNKATFSNIRLWDHRPLKQTYNQLQEIRLYYDFNDVDIDRYTIDGNYSQVMLSARELNQNQLPSSAQTWVNQKLVFTHGLGLTLSPVNSLTKEGLPDLWVKDIPPKTSDPELEITRPQIYYGESLNDYVIINTATKEFDYPKGDENAYTSYVGKGGVEINSFFRKLLFAVRFGDLKMVLTGDISPESRVLFHRNIKERIDRIAPFLMLDPDPYMVINDGELKWVQDAYTTASEYPYSSYTQIGTFNYINYIRNSVKVVIDAYDGTPTFYITDKDDPLIKAYSSIFPDLFKDFDEMPENLKKHIRYPEQLFKIQSNMYGIYHMKEANVFYNKEDVWNVPNEIYGEGQEIKMDPYYIIMHLPDQNKEEFILMSPFTPHNKDNMIGWLAARSDGDEYGKLLIYKFPKDKLIYGPMQIEARIDQDATISEQLTLWGQRGSTVIRGNLLVIPIDHSIIYVEPLYIIADKSQLPELKRIIVSDGKKVVMEKDFETAISRLFDVKHSETETNETQSNDQDLKLEDADLIGQARIYYQKVEESMKAGDWSGIGDNLDNLGSVLEKLES